MLNVVVRVENICGGCVAEGVARHTAATLVYRGDVCLIRVMAVMVATDSYAI